MRPVRMTTALLATTVAMLAFAASANAFSVTFFQSPSGNIGCAIGGGGVRCDIREHTWTTPPKPDTCDVDYGQGVAVGRGGEANFVCAGDTALDPDAGPSNTASGSRTNRFRCSSKHDGHALREPAERPRLLPLPRRRKAVLTRPARRASRATPSRASRARADRHRDAGEDRRVAQRVGARLRRAQFLDEVEELARVVALERDHELLVVEAERVGGVDRDLRVAAADLDVLGHHPAALLERQPVPLALLVERVDDAVLALGGADLRTRLGLRVGRRLGHRQIGVGDRHPLARGRSARARRGRCGCPRAPGSGRAASGRCRRACRRLSRRAGCGRRRSPRRRRGTPVYPPPATRGRADARRDPA